MQRGERAAGRPWSRLGLLFLIAFVAYLALVAMSGWQDARAALGGIGLVEVLVLLALSLGNYLLRAIRWRLFTQTLRLPTEIGTDLLHYIAGFALTATPAKAGEIVRLRWLARVTGGPVERGAPLLIGDRAADLAGMAFLILLALAAGAAGGAAALLSAIGAVVFAGLAVQPRLLRWGLGWLYRVTGRWARLFARARRAVVGLGPLIRPRVATPTLILSVLGWLLEAAALWLLLDWLGAPIAFEVAALVFALSMIAGGATGLPGGVGGTEAAMVGLLTLEGVALEPAIAATAIVRLTTLWFAVALGALLFPWAERLSARRRDALETG
ncbi:MAG: lysylphosphatidylglycerol synthase transmembrane domain-containing protein [Pseudomonadota bacterium]